MRRIHLLLARTFDIRVGKKGHDRFFLFPPEFCPVAYHLLSPAIIWPFERYHRDSFAITFSPHNSLASVANQSDPCRDRGKQPQRRKHDHIDH
jgi:hypothetical protein